MMQFSEKYGPWAVVTGASAGLGAEFARQLAAQGLNVVLVARRLARLEALAQTLTQQHGCATRVLAIDLAQPDSAQRIVAACADLDVGLLINNAGFSLTGPLVDQSAHDLAQLMQVNVQAALLLAHGFGRKMRQRQRGGIVFVSSIVGFTPTPGWAAYSASKSADLFLAEALAAELRPHGIDVLALCPGTTRTEFSAVAGTTDAFLAMDAPAVVRIGLRQLGRRTVAIPGLTNKLMVAATHFLPRRFTAWASGLILRVISRQ